VLRLRPEFIALAETHLSGEPLQMFLPAGYIVVARHAMVEAFYCCVGIISL